MKRVPGIAVVACLAWLSPAHAETLYVIDRIEVPVYPAATLDGERVALIHSADAVELIGREGAAAQVRLGDGAEGWVSDSLLTDARPVAARVEALTAENQRLLAAQRAASGSASELKTLQNTNAELKTALDQARAEVTRLRAAARASPAPTNEDLSLQSARHQEPSRAWRLLLMVIALAAAVGIGFWWGYRTLEKRVLAKYGGLKVY
jgi:hypothetical protein